MECEMNSEEIKENIREKYFNDFRKFVSRRKPQGTFEVLCNEISIWETFLKNKILGQSQKCSQIIDRILQMMRQNLKPNYLAKDSKFDYLLQQLEDELNQKQIILRIRKPQIYGNGTQAILHPNGNIQFGSFSNSKAFLLTIGSVAFTTLKKDQWLCIQMVMPGQNETMIEGQYYAGCFNKYGMYFENQGNLLNNRFNLIGSFMKGFPHGKFVCKDLEQATRTELSFVTGQSFGPYSIVGKNKEVIESGSLFFSKRCQNPHSSDAIPSFIQREIRSQKNTYLSSNSILGMEHGHWLNQITLDFYLEGLQSHFETLFRGNLEQNNRDSQYCKKRESTCYQPIIINTSVMQDTLSSAITSAYGTNSQAMKQFLKRYGLDNEDASSLRGKRLIMVLNINRSHFITLAFEKDTLYMCDSLIQSNNDEKIIFDRIIELLTTIYPSLNRIHQKKLVCSQQNNSYDCGIFALIFAQRMVMKNGKSLQDQPEICKIIDRQTPKQFRVFLQSQAVNSDSFPIFFEKN